MIPGQIICAPGTRVINEGKEAIKISVCNTSDRPIQVGSHFHFAEVNAELSFDRAAAYGKRLDILAGTAVRFEPGVSKEIALIDIAGAREVWGQNCLVNGKLKDSNV